MDPWFKTLPLDRSRKETKAAISVLLTYYDSEDAVVDLAKKSGMSVGALKRRAPNLMVPDLLERARTAKRLLRVLGEVLVDPETAALHEPLRALLAGHEDAVEATMMDDKPSLATLAFPFGIEVLGPDDAAPALFTDLMVFEGVVNQAAGFMEPWEFIAGLADAMVRTARIDIGGHAKGTGFLVADSLLLTNWHVVGKGVAGAVARFDHKGKPGGGREVAFATEWNEASSANTEDGWDFALIRLAEPAGAQAKRGHYELDGSPYEYHKEELLVMLGHPDGRPIQLSLASPSAVELLPGNMRIKYKVNSEFGSSGGPVFNKDFRVVGLHNVGAAAYNGGVPMPGVVTEIKKQAKPEVQEELGLAP